MKTAIRIILQVLKWILITIVILFAIATLVGKSYIQTSILLLAAFVMIWWPPVLPKSLGNTRSWILRIATAAGLLVIGFLAFKTEPKKSIYLAEENKDELMEIYDQHLKNWPEDTEEIDVPTRYGTVHVLACGDPADPPVVMIHAASMGAHSWYENLEPLLGNYRIYSVDNIGEGNKSVLTDALDYPSNEKEVAEHLRSVLDSLKIEKTILFGASNGGFVAMCFAAWYPERVHAMALFGPMGLTQLTGGSIMMLSAASMYPFQFIRNRVTRWALGNDPYVIGTYGDWFECIMRGTIPSVAQPVPMTREQKLKMDFPVLLFLGTKDPIVGDVKTARQKAGTFPDIQVEVYDSGHLVAVEKRNEVNRALSRFLKK